MRLYAFVLGPIAATYLALCAYMYVAQRSFIYYQQPRQATAVPAFHLQGDNADLVVSTNNAKSTRAVLYFGGNAEDVSLAVDTLSSAYPGEAVYALHYRGYGGSTGSPNERDLVADGMLLFDHVHRRHPDVTLVGRSLGSGIAVQVAASRAASRLVLVTPYDSIGILAERQFPYIPVRWLLKDRYDSCSHAPRVAAPTTVIAAERDEIVPASSTVRLVACFRAGIVESDVVIKNAGHNDISAYPEYTAALRAKSPFR